jgi:hypothetical protein
MYYDSSELRKPTWLTGDSERTPEGAEIFFHPSYQGDAAVLLFAKAQDGSPKNRRDSTWETFSGPKAMAEKEKENLARIERERARSGRVEGQVEGTSSTGADPVASGAQDQGGLSSDHTRPPISPNGYGPMAACPDGQIPRLRVEMFASVPHEPFEVTSATLSGHIHESVVATAGPSGGQAEPVRAVGKYLPRYIYLGSDEGHLERLRLD